MNDRLVGLTESSTPFQDMELTYSTDRARELKIPGPLPAQGTAFSRSDTGWASFKKCFGLQTQNGPVLEHGRFVATLLKNENASEGGHSVTLQVGYRTPSDAEHYGQVWIQMTDEATALIRPVDDEKMSFEVDFDSVRFAPLDGAKAMAQEGRSVSD
jgi:hypothetical protein